MLHDGIVAGASGDAAHGLQHRGNADEREKEARKGWQPTFDVNPKSGYREANQAMAIAPGASMSIVKATSLTRSANILQRFTFRPKLALAMAVKIKPPIMALPSRAIH